MAQDCPVIGEAKAPESGKTWFQYPFVAATHLEDSP